MLHNSLLSSFLRTVFLREFLIFFQIFLGFEQSNYGTDMYENKKMKIKTLSGCLLCYLMECMEKVCNLLV